MPACQSPQPGCSLASSVAPANFRCCLRPCQSFLLPVSPPTALAHEPPPDAVAQSHALQMQTMPAGGAQSTPWGQPSGHPDGHPRQPPLKRRCLLMPTRQFLARQDLRGFKTMVCSSVVQPCCGGQSKCPYIPTLQALQQPCWQDPAQRLPLGHPLLPNAMQVTPCSPGWDPHLQATVASGISSAPPLPPSRSARPLFVAWVRLSPPCCLSLVQVSDKRGLHVLGIHACSHQQMMAQAYTFVGAVHAAQSDSRMCAPAQLVWRLSLAADSNAC